MSIHRTGIVIDGQDALSVTVTGLSTPSVQAVEPIQVNGNTPEEIVSLIRSLAQDRPFQRGQLRLVLPHETCECFLRIDSTPLPEDAVLSNSARWLEEECGFDPLAYDIRTCTWPVHGRQAVIISVLDRGLLSRYESSLKSAGLHDVVVISPLVALAMMANNTASQTQATNRVLIHVGRETTAVLAVEDGLPVFFRSLSHQLKYTSVNQPTTGMPQFQPTVDGVQHLTNELIRTLQFYQQTAGAGRQIEHITLSAINLDMCSLAIALHQTGAAVAMAGLSLVQMPDANQSEGTIDMIGEQRLALPLAVSAIRQVPGKLRLVHTPSRMRRLAASSSTHWSMVFLFAVLLAGLWLATETQIKTQQSKNRALQEQERKLVQQVSDRKQQYQMRTDYVDNANVLLQMKQQGVLASDMMSAANNLRPRKMVFQRVELDANPKRYTLRVSGSIPKVLPHDALAMLDEYTARLAALDLFDHTFIEKPQLDGPGAEDQLINKQNTPDQVDLDSAVTFTLVVQSITPWQVQGDNKP